MKKSMMNKSRLVDLSELDVDLIDIVDIANNLSNINRFNGIIKYTVAQHSLILSNLVNPQYALHALMHDFAEAYTGDIITAVKQLCPEVKKLEANVLKKIYQRFKVEPMDTATEQAIDKADKMILNNEITQFMLIQDWPGKEIGAFDQKRFTHYEALTYQGIQQKLIKRFSELINENKH